jgi:protein-tyrosine-phosphatase
MKEMPVRKRTRILTLCTGNICRSPMAEGIIRTLFKAGQSVDASSAGTHAVEGNPAAEFAVLASRENRIDITNHRARLLDSLLIRDSDIILCMEPAHAEWVLSTDSSACDKVYNLADFSGTSGSMGRISDPYGCSLREYRLCFDAIDKCIHNFIVFCREKNLFPG